MLFLLTHHKVNSLFSKIDRQDEHIYRLHPLFKIMETLC
jgi:hypothetical protein